MNYKSISEYNCFHPVPLRRFWVFSDLQQSDPVNARYCMHTGVDDFLSLGIPVDAVCYLGDSTEGCKIEHLEEMADMQVKALARVDAPVYYAMGNHEFDYHRWCEGAGSLTIPMRARILKENQWHTTASPGDWSFSKDFGDIVLFFLSDRAEPELGRWCSTHCYHLNVPEEVVTEHDHAADAERVRAEMAAIDKCFFTFSHYSFHGGNRDTEGEIQQMLLPLPAHHIAHFYGHSHTGDRVWGKQNCFRQISTINDTPTTQFDIASLENKRGNAVRSAIVEWYGGHSYGVYFRDHSRKCWEKSFTESEKKS